ncbi:MFS transporter [Xinfangfangia sp. D13-10-4-6]|uniref:MFS transporter n=1 Tax=Pseudogemmobacter hezensis TaxID=2737662 RepID=UPI001554EDAF|nr:MFS transporter [Pseudogemmobacter hezensis]NPD17692.1 MFS transporter [Pseudogemmobacter hezensis]
MTATETRRARWALAAMFGAGGMLVGAWAPQIPLLLPKHGIDKTVLGLLILGLGIGAMLAMLVAGKLIAKYGTKPLLQLAALAQIPVLPLVVYAPSLPLLALAMMVFGLMMGFLDVLANSNAVEVERRMGRAIMSSLHGFWSLGGFVAGTGGAWIIARTSAGTQSLIAAGVIATIVLIALPFLRGEAPLPPETIAGEAAPKDSFLPKDPGIWILGLMALMAFVPEGSVLDWAALYLSEAFGADEFTAGLGFALFAATMAITRFLGDRLRNIFGGVRTFFVSALVAETGMMIAAIAPHSWLAIAGFALAGFGCANLVPVIFSAAGNYPGQRPGAALSVVTMVGYAGILMAPASIGFIAEHLGHQVTFGGLALIILGLAALAGRTASADHRQTV